MIYRLEIENFRSVREKQILDLSISGKVDDVDKRFAPICQGSARRVPKVVALFGANASGKTTILKCLNFLFRFLGGDEQHVMTPEQLGLWPFASKDTFSKPISFAFECSGLLETMADEAGNILNSPREAVYRYELEFRPTGAMTYVVNSEALRFKPADTGKWQRLFERNAEGKVKGATDSNRSFSISGFNDILNKLPTNESLIPTLSRFQHPISGQISLAARLVTSNLNTGRNQDEREGVKQFMLSYPETLEALNREIRRIDVGIDAIELARSEDGIDFLFRHSGVELPLRWTAESHGTRSFIQMYPLMEIALQSGSMAIMDEMDDQIHALILPEIVSWFYEANDRNRDDAQLWFSCHAASLLENLAKEEVVLCEKGSDGATEIFSLMDVERVRRSDNLYRKYLSGVYGGVPNIG